MHHFGKQLCDITSLDIELFQLNLKIYSELFRLVLFFYLKVNSMLYGIVFHLSFIN